MLILGRIRREHDVRPFFADLLGDANCIFRAVLKMTIAAEVEKVDVCSADLRSGAGFLFASFGRSAGSRLGLE